MMDDKIYFGTKVNLQHGLWASNGTTDGTNLVYGFDSTSSSANFRILSVNLVPADDSSFSKAGFWFPKPKLRRWAESFGQAVEWRLVQSYSKILIRAPTTQEHYTIAPIPFPLQDTFTLGPEMDSTWVSTKLTARQKVLNWFGSSGC